MKHFYIQAIILSLTLWSVARGAVQPADSWERLVLIVACRTGLPGDQILKYSHMDGRSLSRLLGDIGKVKGQNLTILETESIDELRRGLQAMGDKITAAKAGGKRVFLQMYYSGHGAASHFHLGEQRLSFKEAKSLLNASRADTRLFVLDVCFGASFFAAKGFQTAAPVPVDVQVDELTEGEVTITSSALDEQAYEVKSLGGSVFTSNWVMALRGAADKDMDGQVSLFEAYNYTYHKTAAYTAEALKRPQHPSYDMQLRGGRDIMLSKPVDMASGLVFKGCHPGTYSVTSISKKLAIGDINLPESSADGQSETFSLALEPGNYELLKNSGARQYKVARVDVQTASVQQVTPAMFTSSQPAGPIKGAKGSAGPDEELEGKPEAKSVPVNSTPGTGQRSRPARTLTWRLTGIMGYEFFNEQILAGNLNIPSEINTHFGLAPSFTGPGTAWHQGFGLSAAYNKRLSLGIRVFTSSRRYTTTTTGSESPLSADVSFPVNLTSTYDINLIDVGPVVEVYPFIYGPHSLGFDGAYLWSFMNVNTSWNLERTLYDQTITQSASHYGDGGRLDGAITYSLELPRFLGLISGLIQLRAGVYYRFSSFFIESEASVPDKELKSEEYGGTLSVLLTFSRNQGGMK